MTFICTATAHEVCVRYPRPEHMTTAAIAHSLAQINRFNGHAARPYSVAEHSLLVCDIVERDFGLGVQAQFAALMHDAHEAFCGDMHSPGKAEIGPAWEAWEARWQLTLRSAYALHTHATTYAAAIRRADLMALATERRDLMPATPTPWPCLDGIQPVPWVNLRSNERYDMTWDNWRDAWADQCDALDFGRNQAMANHRLADRVTTQTLQRKGS